MVPGHRAAPGSGPRWPAVHRTAGATASTLIAQHGYRVTELGVDSDGGLNFAELEAALTPDTALVSIMWANNETGVIFPMERIAPEVYRPIPGKARRSSGVSGIFPLKWVTTIRAAL